MGLTGDSLGIILLSSIVIYGASVKGYRIPEPRFEVLRPSGFVVSIPDSTGIKLFRFDANINRPIESSGRGLLHGEQKTALNRRWSFVNSQVPVKNGDVINYRISVRHGKKEYVLDNQSVRIQTSDITPVNSTTSSSASVAAKTSRPSKGLDRESANDVVRAGSSAPKEAVQNYNYHFHYYYHKNDTDMKIHDVQGQLKVSKDEVQLLQNKVQELQAQVDDLKRLFSTLQGSSNSKDQSRR